MDDSQIISLFMARDESAISETAQKYGTLCKTVAFGILHSHEDAEEAINDTYFSAWRSIPPTIPEHLSAFLCRMTRNLSLKRYDARTAQKRGGDSVSVAMEELEECLPSNENLEDTIDARTLADCINAMLAELPTEQRKVFVCRYWYFDSIADIAKRFGFRESKVKSMLWRIRAKLSVKLKQEGYDYEK